MTLFAGDRPPGDAPLAARMRPRTLEEFVGQAHIVGPGRLLRQAIEADQLTSLILYGPPGTGKTSLARIIANLTRAHFEQVNAVTAGVADLKRIIQEAQDRRAYYQQRTILFIDEIHRFNRAQQDVLLPVVEDGTLVLIGATTENPFYEVNATLVSRSRVLQLEPLSTDELRQILERALVDPRGLGGQGVEVDEEALRHLVDVANGDARAALNALETAAALAVPGPDGVRRITLPLAEEASQRRALLYDREGDAHYDTISAFIKSLRGSDPDAAVYWLARMLAAGEDPRYIARRMVVHAAEDVGLADPMALVVATAAAHAVEYVGLPEARIPLAEAALYIATAPKSNTVVEALGRAARDVEQVQTAPVPRHLRDPSHPQAAARLGHGRDYRYPHDAPGRFVVQQYLPDNLADRVYYEPSDSGAEREVRARLLRWWGEVKRYAFAQRARRARDRPPAEGQGI
ncbi:MAG: replication-associated recombination protein A [Armatimonadota bacterium]|nr:replication-associated recombination protein A [Armatimonadota bacterium]MDR7447578.1 replication-associated recombination protein A [Armatimonadota bacterium]MDR7458744.1 replication-associated recombination protein A [Armatimonadota bacterium]MDR7480519.1 replication-associated recombination protein A [Armatimonadota bacterium]MDR7489334.1 replication-associated recombination protein A [Armatimonadota bacterium]